MLDVIFEIFLKILPVISCVAAALLVVKIKNRDK